jgi:hypothetical protein
MRLADLAAIVGVVSQETYLLHTTVRENLRYAKPEATDTEIADAARAAQIHDLIAGSRRPAASRRAAARGGRPTAWDCGAISPGVGLTRFGASAEVSRTARRYLVGRGG